LIKLIWQVKRRLHLTAFVKYRLYYVTFQFLIIFQSLSMLLTEIDIDD